MTVFPSDSMRAFHWSVSRTFDPARLRRREVILEGHFPARPAAHPAGTAAFSEEAETRNLPARPAAARERRETI